MALVALLLILGSIATACDGGDGGGGGLTLEEYFRRVDSLGESSDDDRDKWLAEYEEATDEAETEEEFLEAFREFFGRYIELTAGLVADLESIDPPSEVKDAHEELVAAEAEAVDLLEELNERAQRAESVFDVEDVITEFELTASHFSDRYEPECLALQAIADNSSIDIDLDCEEDETALTPPILPSPRRTDIPQEGYVLGSADAPVTVVVYADFQ